MTNPLTHRLSRRERQIMDAIYALGQASANDVLERMEDPPSYSSVRKLLAILEEKGHLRHVQDKQKYVYLPTQPRQNAARSAIKQVLQTFFGGNVETAVATLFSEADMELTDEQAARLSALIDEATGRETEEPNP
ncbi:MAG: putative transcriptional regulator [Capsulimonas sp.]|jgi:predicted transcriptional regulator|nr:putative transcriptional regulator [Capsulimonas sp.]